MAHFFKKKPGIFTAGLLLGTVGIKLLTSDDAKKVYSHCTAAVLRAKECVMKTVTCVRENAEDVYSDAKNINEKRAAEKEEFDDKSEEIISEEAKTEEVKTEE